MTVVDRLDIKATVRSWERGAPPCTKDQDVAHGHLSYNPWDPYAVNLTMYDRAEPVTWTFARDLLRDGMAAPAGMGDVAVWPDIETSGRLCIRLDSPHGVCVLYVHDRARVRLWVRRTYVAMPETAQNMDTQVDRILRTLGLGG